jgi:hypothetical protein
MDSPSQGLLNYFLSLKSVHILASVDTVKVLVDSENHGPTSYFRALFTIKGRAPVVVSL